MTFKCGDVVRLKSGGPNMTILNVLASGALTVSWFDGASVTKAIFHTLTVVKVT